MQDVKHLGATLQDDEPSWLKILSSAGFFATIGLLPFSRDLLDLVANYVLH